ncbi:calcium-responsive transcription factor-like isoform X2 [Tubulanus polymorphus]
MAEEHHLQEGGKNGTCSLIELGDIEAVCNDPRGDSILIGGAAAANDTILGALGDGTGILAAGNATQLISSTQCLPAEAFQIVALSGNSEIGAAVQLIGTKGWQLQVVPNPDNPEVATVIAIQPTTFTAESDASNNEGQEHEPQQSAVVNMSATDQITATDITSILMPPPPPPPNLPEGTNFPAWAARLKDCEYIGDSFRGWIENEVELDLLLTYHKQQTQSFWGTRQSPSPAKPSTRLMWKSQYVPFDGIPFINAGSRAIVMECQFGPRRKGASHRKEGDIVVKGEFKQTCPARIYIKKVVKFVDFAVDTSLDKKALKAAMDKAFTELKLQGISNKGVERFYVQLPTAKAHEFHGDNNTIIPIPEVEPAPVQLKRLHPQVADKIRELVATGETRIYAIRKQLRRFVEKDMRSPVIPERHDLTLFPTVNDLQNHIHQALKDMEAGILPMSVPTTNIVTLKSDAPCLLPKDSTNTIWVGGGDAPQAEIVTLTLSQQPGDDGHVISKVETHLSDGSTQISPALTPETASLLSKIHPNMFTANNLLSPIVEGELQQMNDTSQNNDSVPCEELTIKSDHGTIADDLLKSETGGISTDHHSLNIAPDDSVLAVEDNSNSEVLHLDLKSPHSLNEEMLLCHS